MVTISDLKRYDDTEGHYVADVQTATDYFPFGMQMPRRNDSAGSGYRFAFNGKEMDSEVAGHGNQYDYGFRIYNPRIAKFLSVDPLTKSYPWYTPYQFAGNKPIWAIDLDGLEEYYVSTFQYFDANTAQLKQVTSPSKYDGEKIYGETGTLVEVFHFVTPHDPGTQAEIVKVSSTYYPEVKPTLWQRFTKALDARVQGLIDQSNEEGFETMGVVIEGSAGKSGGTGFYDGQVTAKQQFKLAATNEGLANVSASNTSVAVEHGVKTNYGFTWNPFKTSAFFGWFWSTKQHQTSTVGELNLYDKTSITIGLFNAQYKTDGENKEFKMGLTLKAGFNFKKALEGKEVIKSVPIGNSSLDDDGL